MTTNYEIQLHDYMNTGGGCMVSVFQVRLRDEHRTVYLSTDGECCTISTCDTIGSAAEYDELDELDVIASYNLDCLCGCEKYFDLVRYCLNEYLKKDCKHCNYTTRLPQRLLNWDITLDAKYIEWYQDNIGGDYETDGYDVILDSGYELFGGKNICSPPAAPTAVVDEQLETPAQAILDFRCQMALLVESFEKVCTVLEEW